MALYYRLLFPNQAFRQLDDIEQLLPFMYLSNNEKSNLEKSENNLVSEETSPPTPNASMLRPLLSASASCNNYTPIPNNQQIEHEILADSPHTEDPSSLNLVNKPKQTQPKYSKTVIQPKQPDSLFWCIYIARYGYIAYTEIGHRYGNTEIEEKQRIIEMMRSAPNKIKDCPKRITKAQYQEIMSDFMTNKKITTAILAIFAIYCNLHIWIVNMGDSDKPNLWYMDIYSSDGGLDIEPIIIYQYKNSKYGIDLVDGELKKVLIETIKNTLFRFDNYDMPLKAISNYKNVDLEEIADILNIVLEGKQKKQEIYHKIIARCGVI